MRKIILAALMVFGTTAAGWCGDFKNNGDGTVTDLATGLTWQRQDDNDTRTWEEANAYCQDLPLGGKQDWRLPEIKELQSIVDDRKKYPAIDAIAFPGTKQYYWSATTHAGGGGRAWYVNFNTGSVSFISDTVKGYVRCVRLGK